MNFRSTIVLAIALCFSGVKGMLNGREAQPSEFPYVAVVCDYGWAICSGAILDATHILVAGSCLETIRADSMSILVGTMFFGACHGGLPVESYQVYTDCVDDIHDIAVIRLAQPIAFTAIVQPISIEPPPENFCTLCEMTGYKWLRDEDDNALFTWSPAIFFDRERCIDMGVDVGETEMCIKDPDSIARITSSDHGFPVVCDGALVGLTLTLAGTQVPNDPSEPSVMLRLSYYVNWINEHIDNHRNENRFNNPYQPRYNNRNNNGNHDRNNNGNNDHNNNNGHNDHNNNNGHNDHNNNNNGHNDHNNNGHYDHNNNGHYDHNNNNGHYDHNNNNGHYDHNNNGHNDHNNGHNDHNNNNGHNDHNNNNNGHNDHNNNGHYDHNNNGHYDHNNNNGHYDHNNNNGHYDHNNNGHM